MSIYGCAAKNGLAAAADNNLPHEDGLKINLEFDDLTLVNDDIYSYIFLLLLVVPG